MGIYIYVHYLYTSSTWTLRDCIWSQPWVGESIILSWWDLQLNLVELVRLGCRSMGSLVWGPIESGRYMCCFCRCQWSNIPHHRNLMTDQTWRPRVIPKYLINFNHRKNHIKIKMTSPTVYLSIYWFISVVSDMHSSQIWAQREMSS